MTEYAQRQPLSIWKMVTYAIVGALLGGALTLAACSSRSLGADEEQPPIIVRGGSLIFESGDKHLGGKPWKAEDATKKKWRLDHPKGRPAADFWVVPNGTTTCPAYSRTDQVTVYYTVGTTTKTFTVTTPAPGGGGGKREPVITGDEPLTEDNTAANPTLKFGNTGEGIFEVQINGLGGKCTGASLVLLF